jgi:hypothetical protein
MYSYKNEGRIGMASGMGVTKLCDLRHNGPIWANVERERIRRLIRSQVSGVRSQEKHLSAET